MHGKKKPLYASEYIKTCMVLGISVGESPNVSGQHKSVCKIRSIVKDRMIFKNKGRNYRQLVIANIMAYGFSKSTRGASLGNPRPDCLPLIGGTDESQSRTKQSNKGKYIMATLIQQADLSAALKGFKTLKKDLTLSLAFYGLIHGDVSALHGEDKGIVNELHRDYKSLIPASLDRNNEWKYNRVKADKMIKKFGLEFQVTTFEDFCKAACMEQAEAPVEDTPEEARAKVIKSVNNALVKALTAGISKAELGLMLAAAQPKA